MSDHESNEFRNLVSESGGPDRPVSRAESWMQAAGEEGQDPALVAVLGMIADSETKNKDVDVEMVTECLELVANMNTAVWAYYWQGYEEAFITYQLIAAETGEMVIPPVSIPRMAELVGSYPQSSTAIPVATNCGRRDGRGAGDYLYRPRGEKIFFAV